MIGVVKIGGSPGNRIEPLVKELAQDAANGKRWIVVHGASGVMDALCRERGVEIRMITSPSGYRSRFVGERERELFRDAALSYGAGIKKALAEVGIEAEQADPERIPFAFAKRKDVLRECVNGRTRIIRNNYSGTICSVDGCKITEIMDKGKIPVLPPLALDAESGLSLNIDGDRLAAAIAGAVGAETLVILSNVRGLMRDVNDPESLIRSGSNVSGWSVLEHYAQGNMKRKLVACREALELKVPRVYLADCRVDSPIGNALGGNATCLAL